MPKTVDEIVEEYDIAEDDLEVLKESFGPKSLREQNSELAKKAKERDDFEKENRQLKQAPKRKDAFKKARVDFEKLTLAEEEKLEEFSWEGDEPDEEKVAEFVERYKLPTLEADDDEGDDEDTEAAKIADQATRSTRDGLSSRTKITPEQASEWPAETWARFEEKFPDQAKKVLEGEEVVAAFSP